MNLRPVARRYAAALFDVTRRAGSEERAGQDLADLAHMMREHAELGRVVASSTVPSAVKKTMLLAIMDASGATSTEVRQLVGMLADRDRLGIMPDLATAFAERLMEAKRVVRADVVTAVPLTPAGRAALTEALARVSGKVVTMTERVDPAILGGVVARVGTFVYDGSVTGQLDRLRERLTTSN
jgi:F-type H+-transporting ATPase subunit delta